MKRKIGSNSILFLLKAVFVFAILAVFFLCQRFFYEDTMFYFWGNNVLLLLYAAVLYLTNRIYDGFDYRNASIQENIISWILCLLIVNTAQYFILSLIASMRWTVSELLPVGGFLIMSGIQVAFVIPMSFLLSLVYSILYPAQSTVIIYRDAEKLQVYMDMIVKQRRSFTVTEALSQYEQTGVLLDAINKAESVLFIDVEEAKLEGFLEYCYLNEKQIYVLPSFSRILFKTAGTIWLANTPMFSLTKPGPDTGTLVVKRLIDIVVSVICIIISSPFMLIIWLAVRLHDNQPAIFKQERVTKGGRKFMMYKFRSMTASAEEDGIARLSAINDPRITPIGRFIRRTRMDELPQLFNVLLGSMSIVGPRPERPELAQLYEEKYPNFAFRTRVKAGITGLAQVLGRYNTPPEDKLFLDIMYIETFSILQDMKLILQTVSVLFKPLSTEGIKEDTTTALR